jgi:hypothetical protein
MSRDNDPRPGATRLLGSLKERPQSLLRLKDTLIERLVQSELYVTKQRPQRPRRITSASSKLAYIGHSYHEKTKSSAFFLEHLRQYFDVEVILDREWSGVPLPDLSFLDDRYFGVVFFQTQPTRNLLRQIGNENVIFVPMYDSIVGRGYRYWRQFRELKIVNFSSTLHTKLLKWGFDTMYIQYFPKPSAFTGGSANEIFFWQRVSRIDVSVIARLFEGESVKIHIHKALDPHEIPGEDAGYDEEGLEITSSSWFDTREEMLDVVRRKGIYVAPREHEGIGMSFLEAMAMGKAVVAVDSPTMNEYIEHMKTGYLFDLERPEKIDFSTVHEVQRNAHERVCDGYQAWESSRHRIVDFIRAG